jgi:YVTN family beta-propeller protein
LIQNLSKRSLGKAIRGVAITFLTMTLGAGAAHAQLNAYVTNATGSSMSVIDVATNTTVGTIPLPAGPRFVIINSAGSRAYVALATGSLAVVDLVTTAVIATVPTGPNSFLLTFSGDEAYVYVANNGGNTVTVVDTATNTVVTNIPVGPNALGIATTADGASVWASRNSGQVLVIDTATNTVTATFATGIRPVGISFTPDGLFAYLGHGLGSNVRVFDTMTFALVATIPTGLNAFDNAITPDGTKVYQTNQGGNSVSVIATATNTVVATVPIPSPVDVAITPDGAFAYVPSVPANAVFVIDTVLDTVVAAVPSGPAPIGVAIARVIQVPPVVASDNASVSADEGQIATNTGTVTDINRDFVTLSASVGSVLNNGDGTWSWSFGTSDGPAESQTVTISGDDGEGGSDMTSFELVVDNVAPTITSVSNDGPIFAGGSATITVAANDPAGANDPLSYAFDCDDNGVFEIGPQAGNTAVCAFATDGTFTVNVQVTDGDGGLATGSTEVTVLIPPPDCSGATASPGQLWPPNHKYVAIQVTGIVNPAGGSTAIDVTSIFQDEPVQSSGSGNTSPDATGVGTGSPSVRAERDGGNDGRVYHITFTATGSSGSCTGTVTVGVPHSKGKNGGPVDQGPLYDSTLP